MPCPRGSLVPALDGLPGRCVGPWSRDKLHYIRGYLELFSRAMHGRFATRHYVDLFSGPGRCVFDDDSGETEGSPLVALGIDQPFSRYHFVDADPAAIAALECRAQAAGWSEPTVLFYRGDANEVGPARIGPAIPTTALSVAVIDPTGLDFRFESLRGLTAGRRMDLIYVFMEGMAKRAVDTYLRQQVSPLDEVLGTREWRRRFPDRLPDPADPESEWEQVGRPIVELFRRQLATLGYQDVRLGWEITVRNRRNVPLYYLMFASKHELGHTFWKAVAKYGPTGQIGMF